MKKTKNLIFFVDVDDTIVRTYGTKRIPIPATIEHLKKLKEQGATLYCWSSGGTDYARNSAVEFGIKSLFTDFLPKPQVVIDDQNFSEWKNIMQVHPNTCVSKDLSDYIKELQKPSG